jgi:COP9 signalosome complex subunit 2
VRAASLLPIDRGAPSHRGFKALKQLTKLTFKRKQFDDSLKYYMQLLPFTKKAVTRKCANLRFS